MAEETPKFLKAADGQIYPYNEVFVRMGMTPLMDLPKKAKAESQPAAKPAVAVRQVEPESISFGSTSKTATK